MRSNELRGAVEQFLDAHHDWATDKFASESIQAPYVIVLRAMFKAFDGDVPAELRRLEVAVLSLKREWLRFQDSSSTAPGDEFWYHREALERALNWQDSKLESIAELHKQGVSHEQIARMWGLTNDIGTGIAELVDRELNVPGSVIGPAYIHPDQKTVQRELDDQRDELLADIAELEAPDDPIDRDDRSCPETSEQLFWQNVPLEQAACMLHRPKSDVHREWLEYAKVRDENERKRKLAELMAQAPPADAATTT